MKQTTMLKKEEIQKKWYIIDAKDIILGRLATKVASILRGKHKVNFTPHLDCGDNVIIINANMVNLTGNKFQTKKYYNHSQYPGGLRTRTAKVMIDKYPIEMVRRAITGMLKHTKLGRKQERNLFIYVSDKHPHQAQQPEPLVIEKRG